MYEIQFDNGTVLEVTGNHKFLTDTGWVRADELTENHNIINYALDALCHDIPK
jgi:intein/homing endonuclease